MHTRSLIAGVAVTCVFLAGCQPERAPSRAQLAQEREAKKQDKGQAPQLLPEPSTIDDAQLVLGKCGRPASDNVLPIYNKVENGPVRRVIYREKESVTIDFIPSTPTARVTDVPAPFPHPKAPLRAELPANSVWRFDEARVQEHEILTASRLKIYLPCAAAALGKED